MLEAGSNLYFWGGADYALRVLREKAQLPHTWTIICNNDIRVPGQVLHATGISGSDRHAIVARRSSRRTLSEIKPLLQPPQGSASG